MKKKLLSIFLFCALSISNYAQSTFETSPSANFNESTPISGNITDQLVSQVYFKNISSNNIKLKWKVLQRSIPAGWEYSMCDYATCRADFLDSTEFTMYPAEPQFSAYLWFHVLPHSLGMAVLKVYVYDVNFPNNGETVTWTVNSTTGINELNTSLRFSIFPNPASEYLNIQGDNIDLKDAKIYFYNTLGEEVMHTICNANSFKIYLNSLHEGIYFVRINTKEGYTTRKIIISR